MRKRAAAGITAAIAAAALSLAVPATGAAETFSEAEAQAVLEDAQQTLSDHGVTEDLTLELRDLALALPSLNGSDAREARQILSRPPDNSGSDQQPGGGWPRPNQFEEKTVQTANYIVHYPVYDDCNVNQEGCDEPALTDTAPANGVPDYVDATVVALEDSIAVENQELGWPLPKGDNDDGEYAGSNQDDRFDVYLADLCNRSGGPCVFGYAMPDDNSAQCTSAPFKCAAYLVLDNDYAEFGQSGGLLGLRVTTAHEYNHILQFNLDANQDDWMFEATATWAEEQVFPNDDDWVRSYMSDWSEQTTKPITKFAHKSYGSAIWNHWIEHGDGNYGAGVVLDAWELSREVDPKDDAVASYDQAIKDAGGEGFYDEFTAFAAATSEWNTGVGDLPDAQEDSPGDEVLPQVKRMGKLKRGAKRSTKVTLDNTAYQLLDVDSKNANKLRLTVKAPKGVRWGLALVGRTGGRFDGDVQREVKYADKKGQASVSIADVRELDRLTAVIVNADDQKDNKKFKASLK